MASNDKVIGELMTIKGKIGEISTDVKNFRKEYDDGKKSATTASDRNHEDHQKINEKVDDVRIRLHHKVDKNDVGPLMKLNWVFSNWKVFVLASALAGAIVTAVKVRL